MKKIKEEAEFQQKDLASQIDVSYIMLGFQDKNGPFRREAFQQSQPKAPKKHGVLA